MSRGASSDEVGVSGRGPGGVGENDDSDEGEVSTPSRDDATLGRTESLPKSILGETIRGAGQGASPWKSVKFEEELPEGFPERTANGFKRRDPAHGGEGRGINLLFVVLGGVWLSRVFHILTQRFTSTLADRREEF